MQNKYSENMILKVCYACGIVIVAVIAGITICLKNILKSIA